MSINSEAFIQTINSINPMMAIEIGVRHVDSGIRFIETTNIKKLYGLDIEDCPDGRDLEEETNGRYEFIVGESPQYSENFEDSYFDFIFIDGNHSYESVMADLKGWWPKLKDGGIMAGDDYIFFLNPHEGKYGVVEAVEKFALGLQLVVHVGFGEKVTVDPKKKHTIATEIGRKMGVGNVSLSISPFSQMLSGKPLYRHFSSSPPTWWVQK